MSNSDELSSDTLSRAAALVRERFAATDDVRIRITIDEFDAITNAAP